MTRIGNFIFDTLAEAAKYPLHFRIAVKLAQYGYTSKDFHEAIRAGDFDVIPAPLYNDVWNALLDIENKRLPQVSQSAFVKIHELASKV